MTDGYLDYDEYKSMEPLQLERAVDWCFAIDLRDVESEL